jgi:hypothetical protein
MDRVLKIEENRPYLYLKRLQIQEDLRIVIAERLGAALRVSTIIAR